MRSMCFITGRYRANDCQPTKADKSAVMAGAAAVVRINERTRWITNCQRERRKKANVANHSRQKFFCIVFKRSACRPNVRVCIYVAGQLSWSNVVEFTPREKVDEIFANIVALIISAHVTE